MQTQPPWANESNQTTGQVVVGGTQPHILTGQPTNQQIIYVQAPSFKPNPNYRHISYIVLGLGIVFWLLLSFISGTGSEIAYRLGNSMCCGAIGVACILDAMYYNDKTNWQKQTGSDTASSTVGMIADIVFAIACLGMALLFFVM